MRSHPRSAHRDGAAAHQPRTPPAATATTLPCMVATAIATGGWTVTALTDEPLRSEWVRVRAADLRAARRRSALLRADALARHRPSPRLLVDVEILIERDFASALNALAALDPIPALVGSGSPLRYVGTPTGLVSLISDIRALDIADGVVLLPLTPGGPTGRIADEVLRLLQDRTVRPAV